MQIYANSPILLGFATKRCVFLRTKETGVSEETFHFKQFSVCHTGSAMKVGTDGILLGLLAGCGGARLLDIGTGSGLVALLLAQRNTAASVRAVDIDAAAAAQAARNFKDSPWSSRLECCCSDISAYLTDKPFDSIVCNPPYYKNSPQTSSLARNRARIADTLPHGQLVRAVSRLLAADGTFSVILPFADVSDFVLLCWQSNLFLVRKILIYTKEGKPCKRAILIFSPTRGISEEVFFTLMKADGTRSGEYARLVSDYLIK